MLLAAGIVVNQDHSGVPILTSALAGGLEEICRLRSPIYREGEHITVAILLVSPNTKVSEVARRLKILNGKGRLSSTAKCQAPLAIESG